MLPNRPISNEYKVMLTKYSALIGKQPYNMARASTALMNWVNNLQKNEEPLCVDYCATSIGAVKNLAFVPSVERALPMPLEPAPGAIVIRTINTARPDPVGSVRMQMIAGMASSFKEVRGYSWSDAFTEATKCWDRLGVNVTASLVGANIGIQMPVHNVAALPLDRHDSDNEGGAVVLEESHR